MTAPMMLRPTARLTLLATIGIALSSLCFAQAQSGNPSPDHVGSASESVSWQKQVEAPLSLGEVARRQRAAEAKASANSVKIYTNDNLPRAGGLSIFASPEGPSAAQSNGSAGSTQGKHGEEYYRARAQELQNRLEIHQRELEVLQQEFGENQVQYYSNPSEALQQQYSRQDISGLATAIDKKRQQVEADQQAISDLENEVRREGGDPQWLEAEGSQATTPAVKLDLSGASKGSEEDWRRRLSAAREALARAQEQRQLAEDELRLLQSQQAHDWGTPSAESADARIADKRSEVESKRAAEAEAQHELDALENEFRQSGSPEDWSKPDASGQPQRPPSEPDAH